MTVRRSLSMILTLMLCVLGIAVARTAPTTAPSAQEAADITRAVFAKSGHQAANLHVAEDWAISDEIGPLELPLPAPDIPQPRITPGVEIHFPTVLPSQSPSAAPFEDTSDDSASPSADASASPVPRGPRGKVAEAVVRYVNDHWVVTAELAGAGLPTPEALAYHEVPEILANRLLDAKTRRQMEPILKLLRLMLPDSYPQGYLLENLAIADNWALCGYRFRAQIRKSDVLGQILLRQTDGKWHLVERSSHIDLSRYGVPDRLARTLSGVL